MGQHDRDGAALFWMTIGLTVMALAFVVDAVVLPPYADAAVALVVAVMLSMWLLRVVPGRSMTLISVENVADVEVMTGLVKKSIRIRSRAGEVIEADLHTPQAWRFLANLGPRHLI